MKTSTFKNIVLIVAIISSATLVNATSYVYDMSHPGPDEIPPIDDYDPFADISSVDDLGYSDGKIDIADIAYAAKKYGTSGNSTRNMTLTNLPNFGCQEEGIYREAVEITALDLTIVYEGSGNAYGVVLYSSDSDCLLPFVFNPEGQLINVTDFWITTTLTFEDAGVSQFNVTINENITKILVDSWHSKLYKPYVRTYRMTEDVCQQIHQGINTLKFHNVISANAYLYLFRVVVFIEYYYQV